MHQSVVSPTPYPIPRQRQNCNILVVSVDSQLGGDVAKLCSVIFKAGSMVGIVASDQSQTKLYYSTLHSAIYCLSY